MKQIALTQGTFALIDDEDFERVNQYKWKLIKAKKNNWYAKRSINNNGSLYMHRFIMDCPRNKEIDHRDGNGLNNQKSNLRICTSTQNIQNRKGYGRAGYKGVRISGDHIRAVIKIGGRAIHLGYFSDLISAAKAYDEAAQKHFGEFAKLNFPN
jgi:hypothetical protein